MGKVIMSGIVPQVVAPTERVPSGYTEMAYIQSNGTQYIDTGFKPNQDTRVVMDADATYTSSCALFGARTSGSSAMYAVVLSSASVVRNDYGTTTANLSATVSGRGTFDKNKNALTFKGSSVSNAVSTFSTSCSITLFALNNGGTVQTAKATAKLYSCQIYDSDVLVRDYVPCANPDGEIGLYDRIGKQFYRNSGTGVFACDLDFATCTWEQVITACQANKIPSNWVVGDQKTMTINGTDYTIDIIGKNHDNYSDGSGTAPLTFQLHELYKDSQQMNPSASGTSTNVGGWASCAMRNSALPTILALMPSEVQSGIKEVNKLTSAGGTSSVINTTADKLFLLSEIEVFGTTPNSFSGEGKQYAYYAAGNSKTKVLITNANSIQGPRERSPYKSDSSSFCLINNSGGATIGSAHSWYHVAFAFCF